MNALCSQECVAFNFVKPCLIVQVVYLMRSIVAGRYFPVGTCNGRIIYRSQDDNPNMSEVDKGWSPAFGILFFWYSPRYSMWFLTSVPVKDDTSRDDWANAEVYLSTTGWTRTRWFDLQ